MFFKISDSINHKEPIRVKKMIFANNELAEHIFEGYSKGFHNDCIGIKEPNFIFKEANIVYVFFVRAEYFRKSLLTFKKELLKVKKLKECSDLKITECK